MRAGRDGDKVMGPLFPRLHVNDADKGGPRAPPRNKMALYELFSIPSQRFNSDAASTLPLPPHHGSSIAPPAFSSQGCGHERSVSSAFCATPRITVHTAEKVHTCSMEGTNQNTSTGTRVEMKSLKHGSPRVANTAGNVQHGIALHHDKGQHPIDIEKTTHFDLNNLQKNGATTFNSQSQVQSSHGKPSEWHSSNGLMTQRHERSSGEALMKETVILHQSKEYYVSHSVIREMPAEMSNICNQPSNQEHPSRDSNESGRRQHESARICHDSNVSFREARCSNAAEAMEKQVLSNGRSELCPKMSLDNSLVEHAVAEHCNAVGKRVAEAVEDADKIGLSGEANKNGTLEDADRNDDVSETSMVDSLPGIDISPDDVVGLIGPKHFWKARRAIVNQQRVFAVQVFELHRLIKVQKLIAASPHQLLGDISYLLNSPKAPVKDLPAGFLVKPQVPVVKQKGESCKVNNSECATDDTASADFLRPQLQVAKQRDGSGKVNCGSEWSTENRACILPLPREHGEGPICHLPRDGSSGKVFSFHATSDNRSAAWCFRPPGNQWLIPVMSPSEGLIYKPYTDPCPPTTAFMNPVYSGCGPLSVSPVDLTSPAFGVPVSHQKQNMGVLPGAPAVASYFQTPYGLSVVNLLASSSPVEQMRQTARSQPSGQLERHSRSSRDMSNPESGAFSQRARKVQISEDNDLQGSTGSCPGDRADGGRDSLSLFPTTDPMECSEHPPQAHSGDLQTRVIKVVPHNPRSATESAARIFRSIQKERQQYGSSL